MFSAENSLRAEKRNNGLMLVLSAVSNAFMENNSLRLGFLRKLGKDSTQVEDVSIEEPDFVFRSQSINCCRVSWCSLRLLATTTQGINTIDASMAAIPGVNLWAVVSKKASFIELTTTYHSGGTKYRLVSARRVEKCGEYRASSHIGVPGRLNQSLSATLSSSEILAAGRGLTPRDYREWFANAIHAGRVFSELSTADMEHISKTIRIATQWMVTFRSQLLVLNAKQAHETPYHSQLRRHSADPTA